MRPDTRSISFTWQAGIQNVENDANNHRVRRRIQDCFENEQSTPFKNERSLRSAITNFTLPSVTVQPRQAIREGAEKLSKTFREVRTTFGTLSQKLRRSTRRRVPLRNEQSPRTPFNTPQSRSREMLGRTPTKLYSPFDIESPIRSFPDNNVKYCEHPRRRTPLRSCQNTTLVDSRLNDTANSRHALFSRNKPPRMQILYNNGVRR